MENIYLPDSYKYISAFLTFRCTLDCSYCVNKSSNEKFYRKGFNELSGEEWVTALNRIEPKKGLPISFLGGEPFAHKDFIYIINNIKPELEIDILTNLWVSEEKLNQFISEVSPRRVARDAPYSSIRVSYHPEQMGEGERLVKNVLKLKNAGFSIGIEGAMYPSPNQLGAIERMIIKCRNNDINFRAKSFLGIYEGIDDIGRPFSIKHGDYSRYPDAVFNEKTKKCMCKTSDLLISSSGDIYRCQRDLLLTENSIGNLLSSDFQVLGDFKQCNNYGHCHPCDIKTKTMPDQKSYYTSVEIKEIKSDKDYMLKL